MPHQRPSRRLRRPNKCQKRPTKGQKRPTICGLLRASIVADCRPNQCQKRSTIRAKETYYVRNFESLLARWSQMPVPLDSSVKRDLLQCQKRPTTVSKETCALEPDAGALGLHPHRVHVTRCNHEPVRALATHSHHIRNTLATH